MYVIVRFFSRNRSRGQIYILVVHYSGEDTGDEVIKLLGNSRYQIKSKTMRKGVAELTVEILSGQGDTPFVEKIDSLEGVRDVSLIQYNGEYNG